MKVETKKRLAREWLILWACLLPAVICGWLVWAFQYGSLLGAYDRAAVSFGLSGHEEATEELKRRGLLGRSWEARNDGTLRKAQERFTRHKKQILTYTFLASILGLVIYGLLSFVRSVVWAVKTTRS